MPVEAPAAIRSFGDKNPGTFYESWISRGSRDDAGHLSYDAKLLAAIENAGGRQDVDANVGVIACGRLRAIDTATGDESIDVVRETFRAWTALLGSQLKAAGVPGPRASAVAVAKLVGMEGALILCRAGGNVKPLDAVAKELLRLLPEAGEGKR